MICPKHPKQEYLYFYNCDVCLKISKGETFEQGELILDRDTRSIIVTNGIDFYDLFGNVAK